MLWGRNTEIQNKLMQKTKWMKSGPPTNKSLQWIHTLYLPFFGTAKSSEENKSNQTKCTKNKSLCFHFSLQFFTPTKNQQKIREKNHSSEITTPPSSNLPSLFSLFFLSPHSLSLTWVRNQIWRQWWASLSRTETKQIFIKGVFLKIQQIQRT